MVHPFRGLSQGFLWMGDMRYPLRQNKMWSSFGVQLFLKASTLPYMYLVHPCKGFSYDFQFHPWEACDINLREFGGSPFWDPSLLQNAHASLYGEWFIHVGDNISSLKISRCDIVETNAKLWKIGNCNTVDVEVWWYLLNINASVIQLLVE